MKSRRAAAPQGAGERAGAGHTTRGADGGKAAGRGQTAAPNSWDLQPGPAADGQGYPGLDRARLVAALLVVAIHTAPLAQTSPTADFLFTRVLARLAVPFFFLTSGFFLLPGLPDPRQLPQGHRGALRRFFTRTAALWGLALALYLPLDLYAGKTPWRMGLLPFLQYLLAEGGFYHLWYLPAVLVGMVLCLGLLRLGRRPALALAAALYLIGLFGDSWWGLAARWAPAARFYEKLFALIGQTRSGLFFAPLFLLLGGLLAGQPLPRRRGPVYGFLLSLAGMAAEALALRHFKLQRRDSMYLLLPLAATLLFAALYSLRGPGRPQLRRLSTLVYLVHPALIAVVHALAALPLLAPLDRCGLLNYPAICLLSLALSALLLRLAPARAGGGGQPPAHLRPRGAQPRLPQGPRPGGGGEAGGGEDRGDRIVQPGKTGPAAPGNTPHGAGPDTEPPDLWQAGVRACVEIDLGALCENAALLARRLPTGCRLMAVVKADAYGHGALPVCRALSAAGVDAFAVATLDEGLQLRGGGIAGEILVLGVTPPCCAARAAQAGLSLTAADLPHAVALSEAAGEAGATLTVHLAVDTGMHRLGVEAGQLQQVAQALALPHLRVEGIFSHLCVPEGEAEADKAFTRLQIRRFFGLLQALQAQGLPLPPTHLQSSEGILRWPLPGCAFARAGLALYGAGETAPAAGLRPVLQLRTSVALLRDLAPGETAGYGRAFTACRPTRLAVLPVGYADGIPRSLSCGQGRVLVAGQYAPIAGRICMDQMTVDVTGLAGVAPGSPVTLIGPQGARCITAAQLAAAAGSIPNELLCRLGARLPRVYRQGGEGPNF